MGAVQKTLPSGESLTFVGQANPDGVPLGSLVTAVATILNGNTVSTVVSVAGKMIAGIDLGATLTSVALGIKNSADGINFRDAYDNTGTKLSWTVAGARFLKFDPPLLGYNQIQLVGGSAEGADRTLTVVMVP